MKQLFFDLETTGVDHKIHGIHQLSGWVVINGKAIEEFDIKMQPFHHREINPEALKVASITEAELAGYMKPEHAYYQFTHLLSKYVSKFNKTDKFFLAGYNNASFDNQFLREWFLHNGDMYFGSWFWPNSLDVMVLATQHLLGTRQQIG